MELEEAVIGAWETNHRVTAYLFERLPDALWNEAVPGAPRRTVRMIAGHVHNCRCMWIKTLGRRHGLTAPASVARHRVTPGALLRALDRSGRAVAGLLRVSLERGGRLPGFPPGAVHFAAYLIAHEGHHRGQICLVARQLGHRLPPEVTNGLWQWSRRAKEIS